MANIINGALWSLLLLVILTNSTLHTFTHIHTHAPRGTLETSLVFKVRFPQAPQAMLCTVQKTVAVQQTLAEWMETNIEKVEFLNSY